MWNEVKLGEVCDFQNGFAFKSRLFKESGKPILRISNIQNQKIDNRKIVYFDPNDYDTDLSRYEVKPNDLLIAMSGATTGKIGFNKSNNIYYLNQRVGNLKPKSVLNKSYLYYLLSTKVEENLSISKGAAQPNLSSEQIKNISFLLPPLSEQQRIVAKLDEAFSEIDNSIGITNSQSRNFSIFKKKFITLTLSKSVDTQPLSSCCDFLNGYAFKSKDAVEMSNTQLLRMGNLYESRLDLNRKPIFYPDKFINEYENFVLNRGDIVLTMTGTVGKEDYGYAIKIKETDKNLLLNQRILKLHNFNRKIIDPDYLLFFLRSEPFLDELYTTANGTRQANLSSDRIKKINIPLPSLNEQEKVVSRFRFLEECYQKINDCYMKKLANFEALKSSLILEELEPKLV